MDHFGGNLVSFLNFLEENSWLFGAELFGGGTDVRLNGPAPASLDVKAHCIFGLPVFNVDRKNKVPY